MMATKRIHIRYFVLIQFFSLLTAIQSFAQLRFSSLTVNDGLSQHDVSCIMQDSHGFIWIGTYDGLNRYDGYNIENYSSITNNPESISGNRILCLFEDSQKRLWIGTDGEGLNYLDLTTEQFVRVQTPSGFKVINDVIEDSDGDILVATSNGVLEIKPGDPQPSSELLQLPLTGLMINKMAANSSGIYFATNNGIWHMDNNVCQQIYATKNHYIIELTTDKDGKIWGGAQGYLVYITHHDETLHLTNIDIASDMVIVSLCASDDNTIWAGTLNHGLHMVDSLKMRMIDNISDDDINNRSLLTNSILSLYCDNSNTIWVANRQGVCYASLSPKNFTQVPVNLDPNLSQHIQALLYDRKNIYFGMQSGGCYLHNLETQSTKKIELPPNIFPINFYKFDHHIYLTSNLGLFRSQENSLQFKHLSINTEHEESQDQNIFSMCRDHVGNYYYGTYNGLIIQTKNECDWAHYLYDQTELLRNKRIFTLYHDNASHCIWVGTISEGIYKINLTDEGKLLSLEFYHSSMTNNYHIADNAIWCFYKDRKDNLWVGTDAGLLLKQKGSNVFSQISSLGIADKKIMAIMEDAQGQLWLSNSQGIIAYSPESKKVEEYSFRDGLSTSTFTEGVDKDEDGNIYFGSINGINVFNPAGIKPSTELNNVFLTGIKVHQHYIQPQVAFLGSTILKESINETDMIRLNYRQNNISFEFAGSNIIDAKESEFRYKLIGYNQDWIQTNGKYHFASYSNLKPGDYTFVVEAANKDGIWSNSPKEMSLTIIPAPWKTIWAYLVYGTIIITFIGSFLYFLYNRQKLRQKIHIDQLNHEKEQKIHELKLEFFTDVAHEFKTPLSLIIGPLNDLMQKDLAKEVKEFCFQVISKNTKRMMFLVNQLLDFRKINADINILNVSEGNLSEFIHHTTKAFLWQAQNENIHFNIVESKDFICYFDSNIMEKVLYNIISNAFKYTPQKGIIELEVKPIWKDQLRVANIIVRDSGKGIPDEEKNRIFERFFHGKERYSSGIGLHLCYTLVRAHKGEIIVSDSRYGGAEFVLSIPVSKKAFAENEINDGKEVHKWPQDNFKLQNVRTKPVAPERERILIVEDDHDLRAYLRNCLQAQYHVSEASTGVEGLNLSKTELPDIIVTDVMMPEMDGMDMCKKIKETIETSHIPILMLTAKSDEHYQKYGLDCGAWDYITKPFNTDALLKKIDNIIETRNRFKSFLTSQNITIDVKKHYKTFDQKIISKIIETVQLHLDDPDYSVEDLALEIGLSRMQLHRKLKTLIGQTTTGFINSIRISHARNLFDQGCDRIQEAMDAVGINSYSHFNNTFKKIVGLSPSEYIRKNKLSAVRPDFTEKKTY
jgi:signal transduction histidine kinase/ligand-binding sensor domain-containing protein/DNA-binding NarL/FixJ family response regulator